MGSPVQNAPPGFMAFESLHPTPAINSPTLLADCAQVALAMGRLRPWTLVQLPGEPLWVAARQTLWMRLVVWWANRARRREAARRKALLAARWAELDARRAAGVPLNDGSST